MPAGRAGDLQPVTHDHTGRGVTDQSCLDPTKSRVRRGRVLPSSTSDFDDWRDPSQSVTMTVKGVMAPCSTLLGALAALKWVLRVPGHFDLHHLDCSAGFPLGQASPRVGCSTSCVQPWSPPGLDRDASCAQRPSAVRSVLLGRQPHVSPPHGLACSPGSGHAESARMDSRSKQTVAGVY